MKQEFFLLAANQHKGFSIHLGVVTEFKTKKNGKVFSRVVTELDKDGNYGAVKATTLPGSRTAIQRP